MIRKSQQEENLRQADWEQDFEFWTKQYVAKCEESRTRSLEYLKQLLREAVKKAREEQNEIDAKLC